MAVGDFDQIGSTVFATKALTDWVTTDGTYNTFTLGAGGIANISKTGISKFATRISLDTSNTAPTGVNVTNCYYSDAVGTATDPKLTGTSTTPAATAKATGAALLLGVGA